MSISDINTITDNCWAIQEEWVEANETLAYLFGVHDRSLKEVRAHAEIAKTNLDLIFPVLDRHTKVVCPSCRAICCFHARVAYDFKDLLFIHALDLEPPPHQLRSHGGEHCRYLTEVGCSLPRIIRPFVCNWYYCAPMLELHHQLSARAQRRLSSLMSTAQTYRNQMEDLFCRLVTSSEPCYRVDTENHDLPNIIRPPRAKPG